MIRLLILLSLLSATSFASEKPFVRVRWKGSELRITYKDKLMTYDYGDPNDAGDLFLYIIDKVKTDYLGEKDNAVYMILDVQGPSRGPEGAMSQCGAGTEAAKILFAFDSDGEAKQPEVVMYESCYQNIYSDMENLEAPDAVHGMNIVRFQVYMDGPPDHITTKSVLKRFDPEHPEQGFTTTQICTDRDPSDQSAKPEEIACPE